MLKLTCLGELGKDPVSFELLDFKFDLGELDVDLGELDRSRDSWLDLGDFEADFGGLGKCINPRQAQTPEPGLNTISR